ncbi:hypothetical protein [Amycolatopsis samaneae]|uniref:Uncharacterized protein n=1 Tax=Amycolatopsis samaneae TaxID=664691 RepID=A0ABW5GL02_9PSEU
MAEAPEETRVPAWVWCGAAALSLVAAAFVMSVVVHWLVHA